MFTRIQPLPIIKVQADIKTLQRLKQNKNMLRIFNFREQHLSADLALLLLRLVYGYVFLLAGWGKMQQPTGWMPPESGFPGPLLAAAAFAELFGGISMLLGFLTRIGAIGLSITMAVATWYHIAVMHDPLINPTGGPSYQPALIYLLIALVYLAVGPGRISMDRLIAATGSSKKMVAI